MNSRSMTKLSDLRSAFLRGHVWRTHDNIGRHLPLISWSTSTSEAILPILQKNSWLPDGRNYNSVTMGAFKDLAQTKCTPKVSNSITTATLILLCILNIICSNISQTFEMNFIEYFPREVHFVIIKNQNKHCDAYSYSLWLTHIKQSIH